jgi:vacuolar-type H+-ATPase subunit F/Vma7
MAQSAHPEHPADTRLIVMGSAELTLGFRLIGFETYPEATRDDVESVLRELLSRKQKALVLLEPELARSGARSLELVRNEGGHIVVTEVPSLAAPEDYHPEVEDVVRSVLGPGALEDLV